MEEQTIKKVLIDINENLTQLTEMYKNISEHWDKSDKRQAELHPHALNFYLRNEAIFAAKNMFKKELDNVYMDLREGLLEKYRNNFFEEEKEEKTKK